MLKEFAKGLPNLLSKKNEIQTRFKNLLICMIICVAISADNADLYGTVITELEKHLANIETEFSQFVTLNSTGDPIEAAEVLETAEEHTIALRAITEQIPSFIKTIEKDVPKRLEELQEASDKFIAEDYILPENVNLKERMDDLQHHLEESSSLLEQFELDRV